jgi:uncharacterized protein (DUF1697 family)
MAELKSSCAELGFEDVVTYIQSGNVVFRSSARGASGIAAGLEKRIAADFGVGAKVLLRTPAELRKIATGNPFLKRKAETSKLHVVFLSKKPVAAAVSGLDPERSPGDEFELRGREIYLHLPKGFGRSKLTNDYSERRLGVASTVRNWNTLLKLIDLTRT